MTKQINNNFPLSISMKLKKKKKMKEKLMIEIKLGLNSSAGIHRKIVSRKFLYEWESSS